MKIKAGIVGAAGFAGAELTRLLLRHPSFELCAITSDALAGRALAEVYPAFAGASDLVFSKHDKSVLADLDVAFLAVPHTASLAMTPELIAAGTTVIDLSADYRLKDPAIYEKWYKVAHTSTDLLAKAAFGLPELSGDELASAMKEQIKKKDNNLVGNMKSEGTTPRQLTDLIGSLCDLTSGSGDRGTPVVLIQGYFTNFATE